MQKADTILRGKLCIIKAKRKCERIYFTKVTASTCFSNIQVVLFALYSWAHTEHSFLLPSAILPAIRHFGRLIRLGTIGVKFDILTLQVIYAFFIFYEILINVHCRVPMKYFSPIQSVL